MTTFIAFKNGNRFECKTREEALKIFQSRYDADSELREAIARFADGSSGWRGNTNDEFYSSLLIAHNLPVPEYPESLRREHDDRNARFWNGVNHGMATVASGIAATVNQDEILESGRNASDDQGA